VRTLFTRTYGGNCVIEETVSAGVTNRATRTHGGATATERLWTDPVSGEARSLRTRTETSWDAAGRETETVSVSRNGVPWTAESSTAKDFLGRVVATARAGYGGYMMVSSNAYDSAGRLVRTFSHDGASEVVGYDELGGAAGAIRVGAGQSLDFDPFGFTLAAVIGLDKYVVEETSAWKELSDLGLAAYGVPVVWWDCRATVSHIPGHGSVTTSVQRAQLTGLSPACLSRKVSTGIDGVSTISTGAASGASRTVTTFNTATAVTNVSESLVGLEVRNTNSLGTATAYAFDGFARQISTTETAGCRTSQSSLGYHGDGSTAYTAVICGAVTNVTTYSTRQPLTSPEGAYSVTVTDPLGNQTVSRYHPEGRGKSYRTEGATYPVATALDADGRQSALHTWRDESGQPDITRWHCDLASGLVTNKVYADGHGPTYAYLPDGRLSLRAWARGVETAYGYADTASGQTRTAAHADATPGVTNRYDLAGLLVSVEDGTGARSLAYDIRGRLTAEANALAVITREYNALGMPSGFAADNVDTVAYAYDSLRRLTNVSANGLSFSYERLSGNHLVASMANSAGMGWVRQYENARDLIVAVSNFYGASAVAVFSYGNDALGRRVARNDESFTYNARSELTNAVLNAGVYGYGYDGVGNLLFSVAGAVSNEYTANALNQYTEIHPPVAVSYDADGNMTRQGVWSHSYDAENRLNLSEPSGIATNGAVRVSNGYDYMNRRHSKMVHQLTGRGSGYPLDPSQAGAWGVARSHTFVYDGWNLYREVEASSGATVTNIYIWGLDLSGTLQGAGGVGGLLAVLRNGTPYFPCYDANGNVTDYVNANGTLVAHREFDPFGKTIAASGPLVHDLHFWFSTKYLDEETGLYYYGHRYYSPLLMRWLSRDPIGEGGGLNIYCVVANDAINAVDKLGLKKLSLTYDMQNKSNTSWLERLMMPGNTVWTSSMTEALENIRKKVGKFDPDGKDCNCILKLTITGHSGIPGFISFGGANFIDPDSIKNLEEVRRKYADNPIYKEFLEKQSREHDFLVAVSSLMCRKEGTIRFAQCQTEHPETRKFLERIFGDDVAIVLYDLDVKWKWGLPTEVPVECCNK
jgi:RHS repeat-associated protein